MQENENENQIHAPDLRAATSRVIAEEIIKVLIRKQARDVVLYDVAESTIVTEHYVICTGRSTTHIRALADEVEYRMGLSGLSPAHIEGRLGGTWILLDFNSVIVHVFSKEDREFYQLERLLDPGERVDISGILEALAAENQ